MNIGINLLFLIPNAVGGTETYSRGLIDALSKVRKGDIIYLFCNCESAKTFRQSRHVKVVELPVLGKYRVARVFFEIFIFPFILIYYKINLIHSLGYTTPLLTHCPRIVNIYDLNWYYHPEDFSFFRRFGWRLFVYLSAIFSTKIITSSTSSRDKISKVLNISKNKIDIVYGGTPKMLKPYGKSYLKRLGVKKDYVFTLTSDVPHKNIITLLKAIPLIIKNNPNFVLVIAGLKGKMDIAAKKYIKHANIESKVICLKWITDRELSTLYKNALLFVNPSLHEGFGFTVVESFSFGTPVASSNKFSLKEVVDKYGILFNPLNPKDISNSVLKLLNNRTLRSKYSGLAKERVAYFTWLNSAQETSKLYNQLCISSK